MTSEERMAYYQRKKGNGRLPQTTNKEAFSFGKLRFTIALVLFVIFLSLDYTEYKINGIGSQEIVSEVRKDSLLFNKVARKF